MVGSVPLYDNMPSWLFLIWNCTKSASQDYVQFCQLIYILEIYLFYMYIL